MYSLCVIFDDEKTMERIFGKSFWPGWEENRNLYVLLKITRNVVDKGVKVKITILGMLEMIIFLSIVDATQRDASVWKENGLCFKCDTMVYAFGILL